MKGSVTIEAAYIFPFCFLIIVIICYLGIFVYNRSILKTTGYESVLWAVESTELSKKDFKQHLVKSAEQTAKTRVLGMESLNAKAEITTSKIRLTFYGMHAMFDLPLEVTVVYERTYPEKTLRSLRGGMG